MTKAEKVEIFCENCMKTSTIRLKENVPCPKCGGFDYDVRRRKT